ncbi:MAG: chemotaxis protein CheR, partial [Marivirga sp.]|nr:chemotaxis protein CheR [Marivirga sp.]
RNDQLTESYEYSEAIFDIIREAVLVLDKDLRVKYANKAFYKSFAVDELETEGLFVYELGDRQWDIPQLRTLMDEVVQKNTTFYDFEVRHIFRKIGEKVMLLHARNLHQKSHKQQLVLLAINDVTEHRQAERIISERESWLRNITNKLPVMVWVVDANKMCTFLNDTWFEFTGLKAHEPFSLDWPLLVHPDDLEKFQHVFDEGFGNQKPYTIEYRLRGSDGEYQWFFLSASPNYSKDNKFLGFIGSVINIQNQRTFVENLEQSVQQRTYALQESNKNLEQSNEELRQFAYVASHDLQEPLRKIMTFANLVMQRYEENDIKEVHVYLKKIVDSSRRMSRLINELLNFSRSARNSHEFSKVDLNEIVRDILKDFDLSAQKNKVNIEIEKLTIIDAIPIQMIQLFHNLISNAIKFSALNANPTIIVSCKKIKKEEIPASLDGNRRYIEISISDNGIGFNQQFADKIFIIFQRLHDKQTFPGTGIGLALCKKIVSNHDGLIYADSIPGEGATFHVILPVKQHTQAPVKTVP